MREIKGTHPRAFASVRARTHRTRVNGGTPDAVREVDGDVHVRDDEGTCVILTHTHTPHFFWLVCVCEMACARLQLVARAFTFFPDRGAW